MDKKVAEKLEKVRKQYDFLGKDLLERLDDIFRGMASAQAYMEELEQEIAAQGGALKTIGGRKKPNLLVKEWEKLSTHYAHLLGRVERVAMGASSEEDYGLDEFE